MGAAGGERLVPPALPLRLARLLAEPASRAEIRRAVAPPPSAAGARLRAARASGTISSMTGWRPRAPMSTRRRARPTRSSSTRACAGDDHAVPGERRDDLRRPGRRACRATRTSSPRSTCAERHFEAVGLGARLRGAVHPLRRNRSAKSIFFRPSVKFPIYARPVSGAKV